MKTNSGYTKHHFLQLSSLDDEYINAVDIIQCALLYKYNFILTSLFLY